MEVNIRYRLLNRFSKVEDAGRKHLWESKNSLRALRICNLTKFILNILEILCFYRWRWTLCSKWWEEVDWTICLKSWLKRPWRRRFSSDMSCQDRICARTSQLFMRKTPMIKAIETAYSIETVFYALGLTSIIIGGRNFNAHLQNAFKLKVSGLKK